MDDQSSQNSSPDQVSSQTPSAPVAQPQSPQNTPYITPALSQQQPETTSNGFNEQEVWNAIQAKLVEHDQSLQSRMKGEEGQGGIVSDSYERRMREMRQKLYDDFIKKGLDYHLYRQQSQNPALSKVQSLQAVLKGQSLLTVQAGRDKVFRDDLIKEVEKRLDGLSSNPFDAVEEKLEALSSIYAHATSAGAEQGGVSENWRKRVLREARRKYALSLLSESNDKVEKWVQRDSDLARYLKSLMTKENLSEGVDVPTPASPSTSQHVAPAPFLSAQPQPAVEQKQETVVSQPDESIPSSMPSAPHYQTPSSESTKATSPTIVPDQEVSQKEEEPSTFASSGSDNEQSPVSQTVPQRPEETPQPPVVEPPFSISTPEPTPHDTSLPSSQVSSPSMEQQSQEQRPGGVVAPAPFQPSQERETMLPSETPPSATPSLSSIQTEQSVSQPTQQQFRPAAPGQSFTDFLSNRTKQRELSTQHPSQQQPQTPPTQSQPSMGTTDQTTTPLTPPIKNETALEQQSSSSPLAPTPETTTLPPQQSYPEQSQEQQQQQPEPEKKKGFLSKLFGR